MSWLDGVTFDTIIVHTVNDGPSLKAPKVAVMDDCLVLRDAVLLQPEQTDMLAGEIVIPREKVLFVQKVGS